MERRNELAHCLFFLGMFAWLLYSVHSSTSTVSLVVGIGIMLLLGSRFVDPRYVGTYLITGCVVFALANWLFGLIDLMIDLLGKDPTLTDRTKVWALVLESKIVLSWDPALKVFGSATGATGFGMNFGGIPSRRIMAISKLI